jgi:hypothetical protein
MLVPKSGHILIPNWAGDKTLCGRAYPGVLGNVVTNTNNLHLCGVCETVLESRARKGVR